MATLGEFLYAARTAETKAGGPYSRAGQRAFERSLIKQFDATYASKGSFWTLAPSNPTPYGLFDEDPTYARPGVTYVALRQILGATNFTKALQQMQLQYGGGTVTEPELEAAFHEWMPNQSAACSVRLDHFFTEWFDTAYKSGGGARQPQITGPGLAGPGFYAKGGGCVAHYPHGRRKRQNHPNHAGPAAGIGLACRNRAGLPSGCALRYGISVPKRTFTRLRAGARAETTGTPDQRRRREPMRKAGPHD